MIKIIRKVIFFLRWHLRSFFRSLKGNDPAVEIMRALDRDGYFVLKGFLSSDEVGRVAQEFGEALQQNRVALEGNKRLVCKHYSIDKIRWSQPQSHVKFAESYLNHPLIMKVTELFHGKKSFVHKCSYEEKRPGHHPETGGIEQRQEDTIFFHMDRPHGVLKTMLFLKDVERKDGPFEIVRGSQRFFYGAKKPGWRSVLRRWKRMLQIIFSAKNSYYYATVLAEEEPEYIAPEDVVSLEGKAGDLVFVNTMAYHRGVPLQQGGYRVVLWNYIYNESVFH